jgi:hypothetical protein
VSLVQIEAPQEILRALRSVPDLNMVRSSVEPRGEGRWKVAAYASDEAIAAAEELGAEVRIMVATEALAEHRTRLARQIQQGRIERGEA